MSGNLNLTKRVAEIARKIGAVSTTAAALLTQSPAQAHESDLLKGILDNAAFNAASLNADSPKIELPPPLILTPSDPTNEGLMLAGHRSHSSHSSHRSHVSGSGHSSHFSATSAPSSPAVSPRVIDRGNPPKKPNTHTTTDHNSTNTKAAPLRSTDKSEALAPYVPKTPKYVPPKNVDLDNPEARFELISVSRVNNVVKATIYDLKTGRRSTVAAHEEIDDYEVMQIDLAKQIVKLQGPNKKLAVLKK